MRDINGADFRFAKTLTLPFFGSGIVDLPPGGVKRVKNSRKMQMVFFVFYGRVTVDLGSPMQNFSIGKGGMWQVPRGKSVCFFTRVVIFQCATSMPYH
jgi:centromere protein C